jgi:hypothetical protein
MTIRQPESNEADAPGLGYFVVRVRRLPGTALGDVTGVVERLGTGEKRPFRSSAELSQIIEEWSI